MPVPSEDSLAWLLLGVVAALIVWVYLDNRRHFKDRMDKHDLSDERKFTELFRRVDRIPTIEGKLDMILDQLRGEKS